MNCTTGLVRAVPVQPKPARGSRFGVTRQLSQKLLIAAVTAVALHAQAEVALDAHHTQVSLDVVEGGAVLTVDLTLRNSGDEALDDVTLRPAGIIFSSPDADSLAFSYLYPGAEVTARWRLHTSQTEQLEQLGAYIGASVSATSTTGVPVELSVGSQEGE
ncbi:hypothetical protein [Pseudomonas sp.]|uniref:hypothetical protein n=1 Tax=Pseudomonas sp. TaxID=306 RepID=UPI002735347E|nr:hypothetical protein [Pseudomonas sp.]MDP3816248.1 hypothetical protein [Pseudomonas sp.]